MRVCGAVGPRRSGNGAAGAALLLRPRDGKGRDTGDGAREHRRVRHAPAGGGRANVLTTGYDEGPGRKPWPFLRAASFFRWLCFDNTHEPVKPLLPLILIELELGGKFGRVGLGIHPKENAKAMGLCRVKCEAALLKHEHVVGIVVTEDLVCLSQTGCC